MTYSNSASPCAPPVFGSYNQSFFAIGGMVLPTDTSITRSPWDTNPFFFYMDGDGPDMSNSTTGFDIQFESSTSTYVYGQAWTLASTKEGEGFRLTGSITTDHVNDINRYTDYLPCAGASGEPMKTYSGFMSKSANIQMNGLVTADTANIEWVFAGNEGGETRAYTFEGSWDSGSSVVTTGSDIQFNASTVDSSALEGGTVELRPLGWVLWVCLIVSGFFI